MANTRRRDENENELRQLMKNLFAEWEEKWNQRVYCEDCMTATYTHFFWLGFEIFN